MTGTTRSRTPLPVAPAKAPGPRGDGHGESCRELPLLLVDDDDTFRFALAELLRDDGHEVREFAAPGDLPGMKWLGDVKLAISDFELGAGLPDGAAFAAAFRAAHPDVPVLIVSAHDPADVVHRLTRHPRVHFHSKPVDYDALHALIHRLAHSHGGELPHDYPREETSSADVPAVAGPARSGRP